MSRKCQTKYYKQKKIFGKYANLFSLKNGVFPDELKLADVTPLYKKSDPEDKTSYQPISVLLALSKVYEKILYKQLNSFFETKPSPHLCGFRSKYSTQHALSNLLFNLQNCLDKSGVVGTIWISPRHLTVNPTI